MANFTLSVTNGGLMLLAGAMAGQELHFTQIKMGSGRYTGSVSAAESMVQEEISLNLDGLIRKDTQVTVKAVLQYGKVQTGFYWTEVGVYAKDPAGGMDILYAYGYAGDEGDYIPGADEATLNEKVIRLTTIVGTAANVTAEVSGSTVYASLEDLENLQDSINLTIQNFSEVIQQVTGIDPTDPEAKPPDGSMVVTLTHAKSGTTHAFTGLGAREGLVPCQFKSTAGYTEGDTATIDGTSYTIVLTGADQPETDLFVSGKSILVDVDTESKTINFKAGGGLTKAKLALATATEATVFNGKTFYGGNSKELRTGTALATATSVAAGNLFNGKTAYDNNGNLITGTALSQSVSVNANNIPSGVTAYNQSGNLITGNGNNVLKSAYGNVPKISNGGSSRVTLSFNPKVVVLSSRGGSFIFGMLIPGQTSGSYTYDDGGYNGASSGTMTLSGKTLTVYGDDFGNVIAEMQYSAFGV